MRKIALKKIVSAVLITVLTLSLACSCSFSNDKNSIGKSSNTIVTVYESLKENFKLRKKEGYSLYSASLVVNSENVGTYTYIYTNKRPDELNYSDILIVEINNRTGEIEKFSSPDYEVYKNEPYDAIKSATPIDPSTFAIDSDKAIKLAATTHFNNNFHFNYISLNVGYYDGAPAYKVSHISLVQNKVFVTNINAMTGTVISHTTEEL